ncbi:MAG TPA: hypothetical protein VI685_18250 [Candidatus Angelobacter sp.]
MGSQPPTIDYYELFASLILRCTNLTLQRDQLDLELSKLRQLIVATYPLLPEDKQRLFQTEVEAMDEENGLGLMEAVKLVFSAHKGQWLTVSTVRDYLEGIGFDFRSYRANPLASIATTLKRLVPSVLETTNTGSGAVYRRKLTLGDSIAGWTDDASQPAMPLTPGEAKRRMEEHLHKIGIDQRPNSAYESGMRGTERPKK